MFCKLGHLALLLMFLGLGAFTVAMETVYDAARFARALVDSDNAAATLATVFPADHPTLAGMPFALMEYYASCHQNGSLTFIFMPISRNNQNILQSNTHLATFTVASHPARAATNRVALMGDVTIMTNAYIESSSAYRNNTQEVQEIETCFLRRHPDAKWWLPGRKPVHKAYWARFDPLTIYYVGGFGSEHYIGYIPLELYQRAGEGPITDGELRIQH